MMTRWVSSVTLNYINSRKQEYLRGCIGFPLPQKSLYESVVEAESGSHKDPTVSAASIEKSLKVLFLS